MGKPLIINKRVKINEKAQKKINKLSEYRENSIEFKLLTNIIFSIIIFWYFIKHDKKNIECSIINTIYFIE